MKIIKVITLYLMITSFQYAYACPAKLRPSLDFDQYQNIYLAEVVGVHLHEYQEEMITGLKQDNDFYFWSDTTLEYTVTLLPQRLKKGNASEIEKLKISGCGVPIPRLKMKGLFFVFPNNEAHVIYQTDHYVYEDYLEKVGIYKFNKKQNLTIQRGADHQEND